MHKRCFIFYYLFLILCISHISCKSKMHGTGFKFDIAKNQYKDKNNPKNITINISKDVVLINSIGTIDSIIVLDTSVVIGNIDKIQILDGNIYILDKAKAKGVFCFSMDGKFKWKYKEQGRAVVKGKYRRLGDMQVQKGNIYLLDDYGVKIIELDTQGHFIKDVGYKNFNKPFIISSKSDSLSLGNLNLERSEDSLNTVSYFFWYAEGKPLQDIFIPRVQIPEVTIKYLIYEKSRNN